MILFQNRKFHGASGEELTWKVECNALRNGDWEWAAKMLSERIVFEEVLGVPWGGIPFAEALLQYRTPGGVILVVDDVWTTGTSMKNFLKEKGLWEEPVPGVGAPRQRVVCRVLFARTWMTSWCRALWYYGGNEI